MFIKSETSGVTHRFFKVVSLVCLYTCTNLGSFFVTEINSDVLRVVRLVPLVCLPFDHLLGHVK